MPLRLRRASALALNLAVAFVTTAIALVLAEASIRLAMPRFDPSGQIDFTTSIGHGNFVGAPNAQLRQTKNTGEYDVAVRFNEAGFRDNPLTDIQPTDIYAVGDSYTMGWGVEEQQRYSNVLATLSGRRVRNLAVPTDVDGYAQLINWAESHGAKPQRLIIGLCMENDIADYGATAAETVTAETRISRLKEWLTHHSATYVALTTTVHHSAALQPMGVRLGIIKKLEPALPDLSAVNPTVRRLRELTSGRDAIVLVIPSRSLWTGPDPERRAARALHDSVVAGLTASGVVVVDPRAQLEAGGNPMRYYFATDPHWNAEGHAIAARLLAERLEHKSDS